MKYQRRRLAVLLILCAGMLGWAVFVLADSADASDFDSWYAQPENREWYEFQQWYGASPRNASYYHIREHFGTGRLGDQAVRVADCESDLDPRAVSPTNDHGVFQINAPSWRRRFAAVTGEAWNPGVYHADTNARFAAWLVAETGGWSHWACKP